VINVDRKIVYKHWLDNGSLRTRIEDKRTLFQFYESKGNNGKKELALYYQIRIIQQQRKERSWPYRASW
jgi:hypothetical protein